MAMARAYAVVESQSMDEPQLLAARLLRYGDDLRHEVERELHDTLQQRLIAVGLDLRAASDDAPEECRADLERIADGIEALLDDIRVLSERLYPASLSRGGLGSALRTYVRTLPVVVELEFDDCRHADAAIYFAVAEGLAAAAAQPGTTHVHARVAEDGEVIRVLVRHDGAGTKIEQALLDRVAALGGQIKVDEDATLSLELPIAPPR
jgi:signal transduction histidine kinase